MATITKVETSRAEVEDCRAHAMRVSAVIADGQRGVFFAIARKQGGVMLPRPVVIEIPPEMILQLAENIRRERSNRRLLHGANHA